MTAASGLNPHAADASRVSSPVDKPASVIGLPAQAKAPARVEDFGAYVPQTSCDPSAKPGVESFRDLVLATYDEGSDWGITRECTDDGISEHLEGRAWDWHVDVKNKQEFKAASDLLSWLTAKGPDGQLGYNARRLGIMYIGYNSRIWAGYRAAEGWRVLGNSNPHTDHVHFSFTWAGAMKRTSFWDGSRASEDYGPCRTYYGQPAPLYSSVGARSRPCPYPRTVPKASMGPLLWRRTVSPEVSLLQTNLGMPDPIGVFGPKTQAAVLAYQRKHGLPQTGAVDFTTRASMVTNGVLPTPKKRKR